MLTALLLLHLAATGAVNEAPSLSNTQHSSRLTQAVSSLDVRMAQVDLVGNDVSVLERRIDTLNSRLRSLSTDWPIGSIVATYLGATLSPIALPGLLFVALSGAAAIPALASVGVVLIIIGVAGVGLLVAGLVTGISASSEAKEEKQQLIRERIELEEQLRRLKAQPPSTVERDFDGPRPLLWVASF